MRKGQHDLAAESWQRALAIDPAQFMAHLYLATELDHENKASEAAAHYKDFLEAIARQPAANRPEPEKTIAIVLRMADCETRASQKDEARRSYQLAAKLAAQTKQEKLESIADVNQAALEAADGKVDSALQLYQQALRIDDSLGDKASASEDLLAYGRFLSRSGFSPRLAYACFVKSVMFADLHDSGARQSLAVESQELAKRLGPGARDIRRDPDPALREALGLKPSR
jgi:tetratricopeptide (TPR) repeat protein